jgi:hypothetical protein
MVTCDQLAISDQYHESNGKCLTENVKIFREYRGEFLKNSTNQTFSPYASIRHCLFLHNPETLRRVLTMGTKGRFLSLLIEPQGN